MYNGPVPKDPHQSVIVEPPLVIGLSLFPTVYFMEGGVGDFGKLIIHMEGIDPKGEVSSCHG